MIIAKVGSLAVLSAAVIIVLSGCASVEYVGSGFESYRDGSYNTASMKSNGIAILPVVAGQGVEGYRRPFGDALNDEAIRMHGKDVVGDWRYSMDRINDAGLAQKYNDAILTYRVTAIIDRAIVQEIASSMDKRYALFVSLHNPERLAPGEIEVSALAQLWDARTGDVVWEGSGSGLGRGANVEISRLCQLAARNIVERALSDVYIEAR